MEAPFGSSARPPHSVFPADTSHQGALGQVAEAGPLVLLLIGRLSDAGGLERGFPGPSLSLDLAILASTVPLEPPGR